MNADELDSVFHIIGVRSPGDLENERFLLRCKKSTNIGNVLLLAGQSAGKEALIPGHDNVFWFPDTNINEGEYVRLYTRTGINRKVDGRYGPNPAVYYNYYWGKSAPVWIGANNVIALLNVKEWKGIAVTQPTPKPTNLAQQENPTT